MDDGVARTMWARFELVHDLVYFAPEAHLRGAVATVATRRLDVPTPYLPFAEGGFPTPSGKVELRSERLETLGVAESYAG